MIYISDINFCIFLCIVCYFVVSYDFTLNLEIYHSVNVAEARILTYWRLTLTIFYIAKNNAWDKVYFESVQNNAY